MSPRLKSGPAPSVTANNPPDCERLWWAHFIDSRPTADGVPGFDRYWQQADPRARHIALWHGRDFARRATAPDAPLELGTMLSESVRDCRHIISQLEPEKAQQVDPLYIARLLQAFDATA